MPTIKSNELVVFNHGQILHGGKTVGYFASVKNTLEGRAWIKQLRNKNKQYRVVCFATGTNRRERFKLAGKEMRRYNGADAGFKLPVSVAERFRVYLYEKNSYCASYANFNSIKI
ncbi:MAG: hypothetical protein WCT77_02910 [Bacteroidota bacterium]